MKRTSVSCTDTNRLIRFAHNYMRVHNDKRTLGEVFAEKEGEANRRGEGVRKMSEDQAVQDILTIYKSYTPEPDPPDLDTWPCCPICGEYLDDDGECLMVKDGEANHDPLNK